MSFFRVYVDGALFYHPQMSKLAITDARIEEDAENIDSMTLSALRAGRWITVRISTTPIPGHASPALHI